MAIIQMQCGLCDDGIGTFRVLLWLNKIFEHNRIIMRIAVNFLMGMRYDEFEGRYKCRLCNTNLAESERFSHLRDDHYVSVDILYDPAFVKSMYLLHTD